MPEHGQAIDIWGGFTDVELGVTPTRARPSHPERLLAAPDARGSGASVHNSVDGRVPRTGFSDDRRASWARLLSFGLIRGRDNPFPAAPCRAVRACAAPAPTLLRPVPAHVVKHCKSGATVWSALSPSEFNFKVGRAPALSRAPTATAPPVPTVRVDAPGADMVVLSREGSDRTACSRPVNPTPTRAHFAQEKLLPPVPDALRVANWGSADTLFPPSPSVVPTARSSVWSQDSFRAADDAPPLPPLPFERVRRADSRGSFSRSVHSSIGSSASSRSMSSLGRSLNDAASGRLWVSAHSQ
jgi:hypothetical protein